MVFESSEIVTFGKGNPIVIKELGAAVRFNEKLKNKFTRKNKEKFTKGFGNSPIVTFAAHPVDFSSLHIKRSKTSWSVRKLLNEAKDWYLPIGHPQRCKGMCIDTLSQCPRLNKVGRSYCEVCLRIKDMDSIYVSSVGDRTKELILNAQSRRQKLGTTLNDEIDFMRAKMGEILALKTATDKAAALKTIDAEQHKEFTVDIELQVDRLLDKIKGMVVEQAKIENNRDTIQIETFARVMEGALAEISRTMIDDTQGVMNANTTKLLRDRYEEASFRILESIAPEAEIAKSIEPGVRGDLFTNLTRKAVNPDMGSLTITIQ